MKERSIANILMGLLGNLVDVHKGSRYSMSFFQMVSGLVATLASAPWLDI
jgi:hypothetical protein